MKSRERASAPKSTKPIRARVACIDHEKASTGACSRGMASSGPPISSHRITNPAMPRTTMRLMVSGVPSDCRVTNKAASRTAATPATPAAGRYRRSGLEDSSRYETTEMPATRTSPAGMPPGLDLVMRARLPSMSPTQDTLGVRKSVFSLWKPARAYTRIMLSWSTGRIISK